MTAVGVDAPRSDEADVSAAVGGGDAGSDRSATELPISPAPDGRDGGGEEDAEERLGTALRLSAAVAFPVTGAAVMVGGVFLGPGGRVIAIVAGLLGLGLAVAASRLRSPVAANAVTFAGVVAIGLVLVLPSGVGSLGSLRGDIARAVSSGDIQRPPVAFTPGWHALTGWAVGALGVVTGWVTLTFRRPILALLVPLPAAGIAAISVPHDQQVASGVTVLVLFAVGLGLMAGAMDADPDHPTSIAFELRRLARAVPVLAAITGLLLVLTQAHFLFPRPTVDPTHRPQKPRTTPLSAVKDRVLFEVQSSITGPWRLGSLDVYDGKDWRLPAFSEGKLHTVPRSGIVDPTLTPGIKATFTVEGLNGAVLPGLPNTVGVVAEGPRLAYDARNGNLRLAQGQVQAGLTYSVAAEALPTVQELAAQTAPLPPDLAPFTAIPPPPPAVSTLVQQAYAQYKDRWDRFNFVRTYVLSHVTATGAGVPVSVPPERVQDMLAGSKEGSPFEIVAAQAMLARWVGVPSRIGYGFDGGEQVNGRLQIRPRDGATFVEVAFPGYGWLPVNGTPQKAKPTTGDASQQRQEAGVLPSNDISAQLFIPVVLSQPSIFLRQVQRIVEIAVPIALLLLLGYLLFPVLRKSVRRTRRRTAAQRAGSRARIALAYCEWRDAATDFGYGSPTDTPLRYLARFADDDEQRELAWLTTRALWGDLRDEVGEDDAAAAEELSRALRRRLADAHAPLLRLIAATSRLSLRDPYGVDVDLPTEIAAPTGAGHAAAA